MNVSVVMNTYNESPNYLKAAINSYITQKNVNVQLIVSTVEGDSSITLIPKWYGNKVQLCISTKQEHPGRGTNGVYYQLNKAMELVTGDWFCYASSNDVAIKGKLYTEVTACTKYKKDVCYSNFLMTQHDLSKPQLKKFPSFNFFNLLKGNFISDCSMIRTSTIKKFLPFDDTYENCGFWDCWLRMYAELGNVFVHSGKPAFMYRRNKQSLQKERKTRTPLALKKYNRRRLQMRINILNKYPLYREITITSTKKNIVGTYRIIKSNGAIQWAMSKPKIQYIVMRDSKGWVIFQKTAGGVSAIARATQNNFMTPPKTSWNIGMTISYKTRILSP